MSVEGVDFLLGSDLAGDAVFPPPIVVSESSFEEEEEDLEEYSELAAEALFPVCAITRSMSEVVPLREAEEGVEDGEEASGGADCRSCGLPSDPEPSSHSATVLECEEEGCEEVSGGADCRSCGLSSDPEPSSQSGVSVTGEDVEEVSGGVDCRSCGLPRKPEPSSRPSVTGEAGEEVSGRIHSQVCGLPCNAEPNSHSVEVLESGDGKEVTRVADCQGRSS